MYGIGLPDKKTVRAFIPRFARGTDDHQESVSVDADTKRGTHDEKLR
jgi:hypothetical protein